MNVYKSNQQVLIEKSLFNAITKKDFNEVKLAIEAGADINANKDDPMLYPLALAIIFYNKKVVEYLIENGADVNAMNGSILASAMVVKNHEALELLLKANADINTDVVLYNALYYAVMQKDQKPLILLLQYGADIDQAIILADNYKEEIEIKQMLYTYKEKQVLHKKLNKNLNKVKNSTNNKIKL